MYSNNLFIDTIKKLSNILSTYNIPHEIKPRFDGSQITFNWCNGDVVCCTGSYGCHNGYVESYKFPWDEDDVTSASVEEMAENIYNYYQLCRRAWKSEKTR